MIFITGDTHGNYDFDKLKVLMQKELTFNDYLIICGDVAICWSVKELPYFLNLYRQLGCTIFFVDGNHENFDMLNSFPLVEYKGAIMHQIDEHIFHILRGEILNLDGTKFLCIGGACSIDKLYRTINVSWWKEEEITNHDIDNAISNLEKVNYEVDYVITHCIDTKTIIKSLGYRRDVCTDQLTFVDKIVKYKMWYCGHYHIDKLLSHNKRCLYQEIVEL